MKLAILTLPLSTNYGGILQAYALQTVLRRMGHEVIVLDKERNIYQKPYEQVLSYFVYLLRRYCLGRNIQYCSPQQNNKEREVREQYTRPFIEKYINTFKIGSLEKDVPEDLDAIVVGSDQVWRFVYFPLIYKCGIENAFLNFCENESLKRISYAASFGTDDWEYPENKTKECALLLEKFDAVSVREKSAIDLCREKLGREDVQYVLDPTMLLSVEDYLKFVECAEIPRSSGNLMCYILDETKDKVDFVNHIANNRNLELFKVGSRVEDSGAPLSERIQPPVEKWLRGFVDAKFIVTDSFHACVFSILFGKPFIVIGNKYRGMSRFNSLLETFSLNKNLILSLEDYDDTYDYAVPARTYEILKVLKNKSLLFLQDSLK